MPLPPLVPPVTVLPVDEAQRTGRHRSLAAIGDVGQRRLHAAHVALVGAGGLGSPALLALAAAGIGSLTIIDDDVVELSNLQRQIAHGAADLGHAKVASAARAAASLSPRSVIRPVQVRVSADNAEEILAGADVVLDGSDTFDTREAVAAACERLGLPLVWGAVQETSAQVTVFWSTPPAGASAVVLDDLYPTGTAREAPTCEAVGVLGPLCVQVGALMATEAVKIITGTGDVLLGRVLLIDALRARWREVPLGAARSRTMDAESASPATDAATPPARSDPPRVSARELRARQRAGEQVALLDVREPHEVADDPMPGSFALPLGRVLADPSSVTGPVLVVCAAGQRARRAAVALRDAGVEASVLEGGMRAWHAIAREQRA